MSKSLNCFKPSHTIDLKGFKCLHLNCCSILKKIDQIRYTLVDETKFEYYCFTESWLKPNIESSLFQIDDYSLVRNDRSSISRSGNFVHGGGIVCYIKSHLIFEIFDNPFSTIDLEMIVITINRQEQCRLYLINIYRPPSGNLEVAFNLLTEVVSKIRLDTSRHTIILLGDFNIDCNINKNQSKQATLLNNFSVNNNLVQFIDRPTRFGPMSSSIIDLILTDSRFVSFPRYNCLLYKRSYTHLSCD